MLKKDNIGFPWDFSAKLIILVFCLLQALRWRIFPQFMDIYYHLLVARGFIQAGGYSGWDFWQYAPVGRIHIYPPFFHLVLALLLKLGLKEIFLAKFFEAATPVILLAVIWRFVHKYFSQRLAFFVAVIFSSSFSFFLSLINHIPASIALIAGFLASGELFEKKLLRALLLLALCFYTHIGISWLFALSFIIYGFCDSKYRRISWLIVGGAFVLALPIIWKQLAGIRYISGLGAGLNENNICEFKIVDYFLAIFGLGLSYRMRGRYRFFLSLFLASLIFLSYPYRFFSGEGYLTTIFLAALALDAFYDKFQASVFNKYILTLSIIFFMLVSPTLAMTQEKETKRNGLRFQVFDSAFLGMLLAKGTTIWFPKEYIPAVDFIRNNSGPQDIIYSPVDLAGVILGGLSGRATASGLFPEIGPVRPFDPLLSSKIIILPKDEPEGVINRFVVRYNLERVKESEAFVFCINRSARAELVVRKASVSFLGILGLFLAAIFLYLKAGLITKKA